MALFAILELICGSTTIDLLDTHSGFILRSWRPMAADAKGGGVWRDSPLADGRQLVQSTRGNIIDTFSFDARDVDQDATIHRIGDLRRWLQLAQDYWVGGDPSVQSSVPYIRARGANETYIRYALVYRGACLEENNPYDQPFFGIHCQSAQPALTLALEHGDWLDTTPGSSGTCVQVAGTGLGQDIVTVTASPAAGTDDAWVDYDKNINTIATDIPIGGEPAATVLTYPVFAGVRFPNVTVPQGATILDAYITFRAGFDGANDNCRTFVRIQEADNAATFSTYTDFMSRLAPRPSLPVLVWPDPAWGTSIEHWTAGNDYDTSIDCPLIRLQVQGIVDRSGWVSGNAIAFFFIDAGSTDDAYREFCSFDHGAGQPPPELTVVYVDTSSTFGRAATCNDEVYVANKHNLAQLTNIFVFDADLTSYTEVIGAALPTNLLPAAPANGDIIYFGISTADPDMSGPFSSLVFDIGTAASYTAAATITWQYWNGGWVALTVRDNTASIPTGALDPFVQTGVNSVHWRQPSDWAETTVNGVTGYWVRALVTIGGGDAVTTPTQANRNIYTVTWPYVDIAAAQVGGDLPALSRIYRTNESGISYASPTLYYDRVLVGLRTLARGSRYTPYINFADEQNDPGITISPVGSAAAFAADVETPTGYNVTWTSPGASGAVGACNINFADDLMPEYHGTYHVFLRAEQETGTTVGQIEVRLEYGFPGGREIQTPYQAFEYVGVRQYLDFGRVTIPSAQIAPGETSASCYIQVYVSYSASGVDLYLYDLILMPADEWLGTFDIATSERFRVGEVGYFGSRRYLDIDSIAYPRRFLRALVYNESGIIYNYRCIANGPAILQSNVAQRLWFFTTRHTSDSTSQVASDFEEAGRVQAFRQQRYFGMRGGR